MKEFYLVNKDKLIRTFKWTSIILTTVLFIIGVYNCYYDNCLPKAQLSYWLVMTLLVTPAFLFVSEMFHGYFGYRNTDRFFETSSVNGLLKNGFKKDWDNKDSKWFLSKLIAVGQFDKYQMICEIEDSRLRVIAKVNYEHLDSWDDDLIKNVRQSFSHIKFEYDGEGIATSLKLRKVRKMTYGELDRYLRDLQKCWTN